MSGIVLIDRSDDVGTLPVVNVAQAIDVEMRALCKAWGWDYWRVYHGNVATVDDHHSMVIVDESSKHPDWIAWHNWNLLDGPNATVVSRRGHWTVAASHEAWEMRGNPNVNKWAPMPFMSGTECAFELSDAVQGDAFNVQTTAFGQTLNVKLQNYILPAWFDESAQGPYDRMGLCKRPGEIRPGGYMPLRRGLKTWAVWGKSVPRWQWRKNAMLTDLYARKLAGSRSQRIIGGHRDG